MDNHTSSIYLSEGRGTAAAENIICKSSSNLIEGVGGSRLTAYIASIYYYIREAVTNMRGGGK